MQNKAPKLIIALDLKTEAEAYHLADHIDPTLCSLKVGSEMFTRFGPLFVKNLIKRQFRIFLDLKFHDIPTTVANACCAGADLGVWMLNVHASGGLAMMEKARLSLDQFGSNRPLIIAVTILTSQDTQEVNDKVKMLAKETQDAGLDGVVCSVWEVPQIKENCGLSFMTVTPGIRNREDQAHDQTRIATPQLALETGSDFLVVGRPITGAPDPIVAAQTWVSILNA